jgi:hypothetical protein
MKLTNRIGKVLNPKTKREEIAPVEVEIETIPIRRPALSYFIALDAMELATDDGLVEIAKGDCVVCSDTGRFEAYPPAAFQKAFSLGLDPAGGSSSGAALDTRDRLSALESLVAQQGTEITRLKAAAALSSSSSPSMPSEQFSSGQG